MNFSDYIKSSKSGLNESSNKAPSFIMFKPMIANEKDVSEFIHNYYKKSISRIAKDAGYSIKSTSTSSSKDEFETVAECRVPGEMLDTVYATLESASKELEQLLKNSDSAKGVLVRSSGAMALKCNVSKYSTGGQRGIEVIQLSCKITCSYDMFSL